MSTGERRRLVVEADGGSRGNPGTAGYGAVVRDAATMEVLARRAAPLGIASNNVAEYSGLIAGLEAAAGIDPGARVEARLDSRLVVEQLSGRWKIKHEDMRRLAIDAREVIRGLEAHGGSVTLTWVPRERNKDADALSNTAMDGHTVVWNAGSELVAGPGDDEAADPAANGAALTSDGEPDRGEPVRVILVRHGVTDFTVSGRLDGRGGADPSLNAEGMAQAAAAARAIVPLVDPVRTVVVTSSLARARQTGGIIAEALALDAVVDADWDEQNFGDWDGAAMPDLMANHDTELSAFRTDTGYARPGGESHDQLRRRVLEAFGRAKSLGGTVVVATHRKPVLVVLAEVLALPHARFWALATAPASLTAIQLWRDGTTQVAFVNRTAHLAGR